METNTNNRPAAKSANGKLALKLFIILIISLLLLIPRIIIQHMIDERHSTEELACEEVGEKWGPSCLVTGPVLFIPGDSAINNVYLMPEELQVQGDIHTRTLNRGIFDIKVYESSLVMEGHFVLPRELTADKLGHLRWQKAKLLFSVNDFRAFSDNPKLAYLGSPVELSSEGMQLGNDAALSCAVAVQPLLEGGKAAFRLEAPLKGSSALSIVPVGRTTKVHLTSDCPSPSFDGRYLPSDREITAQGFTADWNVLALNRDFSQVLSSQSELGGAGTIDVGLRVPVEQYQQTTRTIKYAYLIIFLTFAVVFFIEMRRRTPIHPVQYALVGIALILFYTLLLSFSEHLTFLVSYLIASAMTVALITLFMRAVLRNTRAALAIGGLLVLLYAFIYILLQLESYALLVGSVGVFVILAIAMYASQKIEWYA